MCVEIQSNMELQRCGGRRIRISDFLQIKSKKLTVQGIIYHTSYILVLNAQKLPTFCIFLKNCSKIWQKGQTAQVCITAQYYIFEQLIYVFLKKILLLLKRDISCWKHSCFLYQTSNQYLICLTVFVFKAEASEAEAATVESGINNR